MIPALIADWKRDMGPKFAAKTMETYTSRLNRIADPFADFRVTDVESSGVAEFLRDFRHQVHTHNQFLSPIQELMRYSIERGVHKDNPVTDIIKTMSEKPRTRYITDKDEAEGIGAARRMGAHSTEAQTADYVRHKKALKTGANR